MRRKKINPNQEEFFSLDQNINRVNRSFDRQISKGHKTSVYEKLLFNMTLDFTLDDWKIIRTKKFWSKLDTLTNRFSKSKYIFTCVDDYIKYVRK